MSDLFNTLIDTTKNEYADIADNGILAGDVSGYIDTGAYALNALFSGSIYKGMPGNKVTAFAGEPAAGKTFFALNAVKQFLEDNQDGFVFYFESESAITREMFIERGIDAKRVAIVPVATVEEFRTQAVKVLNKYMETDTKKKTKLPPMLFVLDSLGNLSTVKEVTDIETGSDKRDMTKAQLVKGAFRVITLKMGKASVPMIVTNHIYNVIGSYIPTKAMGGGDGLPYAASTIAFLSKKKERDKTTKEVTGVLITVNLHKARLTIENRKVTVLLDYATGLNRYYGLLDLGVKFGVIKKVSTKFEFPDGTSAFEKHIWAEPEKYFTKEVLDKIDEGCKEYFLYGGKLSKVDLDDLEIEKEPEELVLEEEVE